MDSLYIQAYVVTRQRVWLTVSVYANKLTHVYYLCTFTDTHTHTHWPSLNTETLLDTHIELVKVLL